MCHIGKKMSTTIETLRSYRVLDMALFDWVMSLLGAFALGFYVFGLKTLQGWSAFVVGWIAFGVIVHYVVGVPTQFGYYLGLNEKVVRT